MSGKIHCMKCATKNTDSLSHFAELLVDIDVVELLNSIEEKSKIIEQKSAVI